MCAPKHISLVPQTDITWVRSFPLQKHQWFVFPSWRTPTQRPEAHRYRVENCEMAVNSATELLRKSSLKFLPYDACQRSVTWMPFCPLRRTPLVSAFQSSSLISRKPHPSQVKLVRLIVHLFEQRVVWQWSEHNLTTIKQGQSWQIVINGPRTDPCVTPDSTVVCRVSSPLANCNFLSPTCK